jgi:molybdenum cofactor synthesis domain-containing protein
VSKTKNKEQSANKAASGPGRAAVLTVSDGVSAGTRVDTAGPAIVKLLREASFVISAEGVTPDDPKAIASRLRQFAQAADLIVTVGGTGVAARDVTPEATLSLSHRIVPGFSELMRAEGSKQTLLAYLSRGVAVTFGSCLILNLPGSLRGATESLRAVLPLLSHAIDLLRGKTEHRISDEQRATSNE